MYVVTHVRVIQFLLRPPHLGHRVGPRVALTPATITKVTFFGDFYKLNHSRKPLRGRVLS